MCQMRDKPGMWLEDEATKEEREREFLADDIELLVRHYGAMPVCDLAIRLKVPYGKILQSVRASWSLKLVGDDIVVPEEQIDSEYGPVYPKELENLRETNCPTPEEVYRMAREIRFKRNRILTGNPP